MRMGIAELHHFRSIFNQIELFTYDCLSLKNKGNKIQFRMRYKEYGNQIEGLIEACKAIDLGYVKPAPTGE